MNDCARDGYSRADKSLRREWSQLLEIVKGDPDETKQLSASDNAWRAYRAAWCRAAAWDERGKVDWMQWHFGCLAELTRQRTKEIDDLILGEGF